MPSFSRGNENEGITVEVHRGGVTFITYNSDPQHGGTGSSSRTFAQVLAGEDMPWQCPADLLAEIQEAVRQMPRDDSPNGWTYNGLTLLADASARGNVAEVKRLLAAGADVHAKSLFGRTALGEAAPRRHLEVVELLIDAGAKPEGIVLKDCFLWRQKHGELMRRLVDAGAPVTALDIWHAGACEDPAALAVLFTARPDLRAALERLRTSVEAKDLPKMREAWMAAGKDLDQMLPYLEPDWSRDVLDISRTQELTAGIQKLLG